MVAARNATKTARIITPENTCAILLEKITIPERQPYQQQDDTNAKHYAKNQLCRASLVPPSTGE